MTKIRFFWPRDYRSGKKNFSKSNLIISEVFIEDILPDINNLFITTELGKFLFSNGHPLKHCYWVSNNNIDYYAFPGITVFIKGFKLEYFFIPTYRKLRTDIELEYKIKIVIDEPLNIKIVDESLMETERKIIFIDNPCLTD